MLDNKSFTLDLSDFDVMFNEVDKLIYTEKEETKAEQTISSQWDKKDFEKKNEYVEQQPNNDNYIGNILGEGYDILGEINNNLYSQEPDSNRENNQEQISTQIQEVGLTQEKEDEPIEETPSSFTETPKEIGDFFKEIGLQVEKSYDNSNVKEEITVQNNKTIVEIPKEIKEVFKRTTIAVGLTPRKEPILRENLKVLPIKIVLDTMPIVALSTKDISDIINKEKIINQYSISLFEVISNTIVGHITSQGIEYDEAINNKPYLNTLLPDNTILALEITYYNTENNYYYLDIMSRELHDKYKAKSMLYQAYMDKMETKFNTSLSSARRLLNNVSTLPDFYRYLNKNMINIAPYLGMDINKMNILLRKEDLDITSDNILEWTNVDDDIYLNPVLTLNDVMSDEKADKPIMEMNDPKFQGIRGYKTSDNYWNFSGTIEDITGKFKYKKDILKIGTKENTIYNQIKLEHPLRNKKDTSNMGKQVTGKKADEYYKLKKYRAITNGKSLVIMTEIKTLIDYNKDRDIVTSKEINVSDEALLRLAMYVQDYKVGGE